MRTLEGGFFLSAGYIVSTILGIVTSIFVMRYFGPAQFGVFTLGLTIVILCVALTTCVEQSLERYVPGYTATGQVRAAKKMYAIVACVKLLLGIVVTLALSFMSAKASAWFRIDTLSLVLKALAIYAFSYSLWCIVNSALIGLQAYFWHAVCNAAQSSAGIIAVSICFFYRGPILLFVTFFAWIHLAVTAISFLCVSFVFRGRTICGDYPDGPSGKQICAVLYRYAWPLSLGNILNVAYVNFGRLFVGMFFQPQVLGYFSLARGMVERFAGLSTNFITPLTPAFSMMHARGEQEKLRESLYFSFKCMALAGLWLTVSFFVFARDLIQLFGGSEYLPAVGLVRILSFVFFVRLPFMTLCTVFYACEKTGRLILVQLLFLVSEIALCFLLMNGWHISGVAAAHVMSYLAVLCVSLFIVGGFFPLDRKRYAVFSLRVLLCAFVLVGPAALFENLSGGNRALHAAIGALWVSCFFMGVVYRYGDFSRADTGRLRSMQPLGPVGLVMKPFLAATDACFSVFDNIGKAFKGAGRKQP